MLVAGNDVWFVHDVPVLSHEVLYAVGEPVAVTLRETTSELTPEVTFVRIVTVGTLTLTFTHEF